MIISTNEILSMLWKLLLYPSIKILWLLGAIYAKKRKQCPYAFIKILQYDFILPLLPIFYHYSRSVQIPKFETTANVNVTNRDIRKKILQNHSNCGIYQSVDQQQYGNIYVSWETKDRSDCTCLCKGKYCSNISNRFKFMEGQTNWISIKIIIIIINLKTEEKKAIISFLNSIWMSDSINEFD